MRFCESAAGLRHRRFGIPGCKIDLVAQSGQLGQAARQIIHAGTLAVGAVQRQRLMIAALQDGGHQPRQTMAGTDFKEGADAGIVQPFDFSDELDWPGQLPCEQIAGCGGIVGIRLGRAVGEDGHRSGMELDVFQSGAERFGGGGDERTVEGRRHGQTLGCGSARAAEGGGGAFDVRRSSRKHRLLRSVLVGENEIEVLGPEHFGIGSLRRLHGEHGPVVAGRIGHESAAKMRQTEELIRLQPAGGAQGGQLAVAVSGGGVGADAELFENSPGAERDGAQGGLGDVGGSQGFLVGTAILGREGFQRINTVD